jgi:hypothetical protein
MLFAAVTRLGEGLSLEILLTLKVDNNNNILNSITVIRSRIT